MLNNSNMKYSFNWLKELSGTKLLPEKAVELLTMHSMEVEGVEKTSGIPEGVVVGKILEIKKHPNADKLQLVKVDVGLSAVLPSLLTSLPITGERESKKGIIHIVCGAWNIKVGDMVPVALVGTKLPNGMEIKAAEIRGEKSFGMLCAEDELGLGEDHSGILILSKKAKIGEPVSKYLGAGDTIIEIKVLPDRAHDALSHVGVAREIAVLEGKKFSAKGGSASGGDYDFDGLRLSNKKSKMLSVKIKDKKLCPRYIGAVMTGLEVKPSPEWMQERLRVCGINAINNIVDATNYVMLELGQPLHAFDLEKITNYKLQITQPKADPPMAENKPQISKYKTQIVVRKAKDKEKVTLLDENEIDLTENDLLITNGETPLALAGIMGGKNSGIIDDTKTIVLEAASFNATNIRRTRTRLGVRSESSDRFEKDLDPNLAKKAMVRLIEILEHTAGAKLEGITDVYLSKVKPWKIKLDLDYANSLLGENISVKAVAKILASLGFKVSGNEKVKTVEVPTFRIDARTQEDLIEEIGRVWGYEKIEARPLVEAIEPAKVNEQVFFERRIKDILAGLGFDEVYNYSFYSRRDAENCGFIDIKHYELANPMNPEQELVRVNLVPNILKNVRENLKHFEKFNIFEIGRVYYPDNNKVEEKRTLAMAAVLNNDKNADAFYDIKGVLEDLLENFGVAGGRATSTMDVPRPRLAHPGRCAEITIGGENIGMIAEINPRVLAQYKIKNRVAMVELDLKKLLKVLPKEKTYQPISKFPIVSRDISMVVPSAVAYAEIKNLIEKTGGDLIKNVELFDRFEAKRSLAIRIFMSAQDRTLESTEVDAVMNKIVSKLENNLKVEVRR